MSRVVSHVLPEVTDMHMVCVPRGESSPAYSSRLHGLPLRCKTACIPRRQECMP